MASLAQLAGHPRALVGAWLWPGAALAIYHPVQLACAALGGPDLAALVAHRLVADPLIWLCAGWVAVSWHRHILADLPVVRRPIPRVVPAILYAGLILGFFQPFDLLSVSTEETLRFNGAAVDRDLAVRAAVETALRFGLLYVGLRLSPTLVSVALWRGIAWPDDAWQRTRAIAPALLVCAAILIGIEPLSMIRFGDAGMIGWQALARLGWPLVLGMIGISVITTIYATTAPAPD